MVFGCSNNGLFIFYLGIRWGVVNDTKRNEKMSEQRKRYRFINSMK